MRQKSFSRPALAFKKTPARFARWAFWFLGGCIIKCADAHPTPALQVRHRSGLDEHLSRQPGAVCQPTRPEPCPSRAGGHGRWVAANKRSKRPLQQHLRGLFAINIAPIDPARVIHEPVRAEPFGGLKTGSVRALPKPFDKLEANGFLNSVINRAGPMM